MNTSKELSKSVLPSGITQEMVDNAKVKYPKEGAVKYADLPLDDYGDQFLTVLICRPNRQVINEFSKWVDKNPGKANEILVKSCLLSHKETVLADDELFTVAVDAIAQLISIRKAIVKNI
ncbi:hypothetical protein [Pedobacter sp. NJ-S-72]